MSARPWMPLYVGDFLADTMHLGATETGIYMRLVMHCWQHGSIPRDDRTLARIAHCDSRLWQKYRETVLQFFDVVNDVSMQQKRVSSELRRAEEISSKRKAAALQKHSKSSAHAEQKHTQPQPQPQSQGKEDISPSLRSGSRVSHETDWPKDFREQFWTAYPRKAGKLAAFKKLDSIRKRGDVPFARLLIAVAAIPINEPQFIPHPSTWLNQGRWDDEHLPGAPNGKRTHNGNGKSGAADFLAGLAEVAENIGREDRVAGTTDEEIPLGRVNIDHR